MASDADSTLEEPLLSTANNETTIVSEADDISVGEASETESSPSAHSRSFFAELRALTPRSEDDEGFPENDDDEHEDSENISKVVICWNGWIRRHSRQLLWILVILWPLGIWSFGLLERTTDSTFHPVPSSPSQLAVDAFDRNYKNDWSSNPALYVVLTSANSSSLTRRHSKGYQAASEWTKGLNQTLDLLSSSNRTTGWIRMTSYYDLVDQNLGTMADALATPHGRSTICQIQYLVNASIYEEEREFIASLIQVMRVYAQTNPSDAFDVGFTGLKFFADDSRASTHTDLRRMDMLVLPIALFLVGYVLPNARTRYLWIVPLVTMMTTVACWSMVLSRVARYMQITQFTPSMMMSLTLGMGIDYTLFLLARYLEVVSSKSRSASIMHMVQYGGHVLVLSGLTLLCVFLGLCFLPLSMLKSIGVGCAVAIACSLLVNLTLVPAMLYTRIGEWIVDQDAVNQSPAPDDISIDESERFGDRELSQQVIAPLPSIWFRMSKQLLHKYRGTIILLACCQLLVPVAVFSGQMKSSLSFDLLLPYSSPSLEVFEQLGEQVGHGKLNPYRILFDGHEANLSMTSSSGFDVMHRVITSLKLLDSSEDHGDRLVWSRSEDCLHSEDGKTSSDIDCMSGYLNTTNGKGVHYNGVAIISNTNLPHYAYVSAKACVGGFYPDPCPVEMMRVIDELDNLCTSEDDYATFVTATLGDNPFDDDGVAWLRAARQIITETDLRGIQVHIDGPAAVAYDAVQSVHESFPVMTLITTVIVFVLVGVFFRSALTPVRSIVSIGLTLGFSFGWTVLIFQKGILKWTHVRMWAATDQELCWLVPVMGFSMVVGLALDYDVFLMSRIWEYRHNEAYEHRSSIAAGLHSTGGIITAAGCIMALAFGSLSLSASPVLVQWSCVVTTAVLLDTCVIRTIVVPILTGLVGDKMCWWPQNMPSARFVYEVFRDDADITGFLRALEASSEYEPIQRPSRPASP